jgi:hypothetical protein
MLHYFKKYIQVPSNKNREKLVTWNIYTDMGNNIKLDHKNWMKGVDWFRLAQNRVKRCDSKAFEI